MPTSHTSEILAAFFIFHSRKCDGDTTKICWMLDFWKRFNGSVGYTQQEQLQ